MTAKGRLWPSTPVDGHKMREMAGGLGRRRAVRAVLIAAALAAAGCGATEIQLATIERRAARDRHEADRARERHERELAWIAADPVGYTVEQGRRGCRERDSRRSVAARAAEVERCYERVEREARCRDRSAAGRPGALQRGPGAGARLEEDSAGGPSPAVREHDPAAAHSEPGEVLPPADRLLQCGSAAAAEGDKK